MDGGNDLQAMADRHHRKNGFGAPVSETASQFPTSLHHTQQGKSNMSLYSSHADDGYSNANTRNQSRHATLKKANERSPPGPPMPPIMKLPATTVEVVQIGGAPTAAVKSVNTNNAAKTSSNANNPPSNANNPVSPSNNEKRQRDSVHIRRANSSETRLPGSTAPAVSAAATAAPANSPAVRKGVLKQSPSPGLPEKTASPPLPQQQQQQQQQASQPKQQQEEREPERKTDESHTVAKLTAAQQPKSSSSTAASQQPPPAAQLLVAPRPTRQLATLDEEGLRSLSASPRPHPLPLSGTRPSQLSASSASSTSSSAAATAAVGIAAAATAAGVATAARSISASASSSTAAAASSGSAASAASSASGSRSAAAAVQATTGASLSSDSSRTLAGTTGAAGGAGSARFQPTFDTEFSIPPRLAMMNAAGRSAYSPRGPVVAGPPLRLQTMHGVGMVAQATYQQITIESSALVRAPLKLHPQNLAAQQAALMAQTLSPQAVPSIYSYSSAGPGVAGVEPAGGSGHLADDDQPFLLNRTQSEMMPNRRLDPSAMHQLGGAGGGGGAGGYTHLNPPVSRVLRPMVAPDLPGNFYLPPGILNDAPPVAQSPMMGSIQARRDAKKKSEAASREAARRTVPTQHRRFLSGADQDKLVQGGSAFPALNPDDEMAEMCLDHSSPLGAAMAAAQLLSSHMMNSPAAKGTGASSASSSCSEASAAASVAVAAGSPAIAAAPGSGSSSGGSGDVGGRIRPAGDPVEEISPQFRVPSGAEMSLMTLESDFDLRREHTAPGTDSDKSNKNSPGHYAASSHHQRPPLHRTVPPLQSAGLRIGLSQQQPPTSPAGSAVGPSSRAVLAAAAAAAVASSAAASSASSAAPAAVPASSDAVRRNSFSVPKHLACMHVSLTDGAAPRSPGVNPLSPSLSPRRRSDENSGGSSH